MKRVVEIVGWLTAIIIFMYASHAVFAQVNVAEMNEPPAQEEEESDELPLTSEAGGDCTKEQEACELAARFVRRLRETHDFAALMPEFFVSDAVGRYRQFLESAKIDGEAPFEPRLLSQASEDDVRRTYVAFLNFWHEQYSLDEAADKYLEATGGVENRPGIEKATVWEVRRKISKDALPPRFFSIAARDPFMSHFVEAFFETTVADKEESESGDEAAAPVIRSLEQLRSVIKALEECLPLMREAVKKLEAQTPTADAAPGDANATEDLRVYKLTTHTLEKETASFPVGTQFVVARISPYEMIMIRTSGGLKMLVVLPDFDGD